MYFTIAGQLFIAKILIVLLVVSVIGLCVESKRNQDLADARIKRLEKLNANDPFGLYERD